MLSSTDVELFRARLSRGFYKWNVGEVMKTVREDPAVLTNCGKTLALQRACDMDRTIASVELIRLLIKEGTRQNFGERGGLRMDGANHSSAPLQVLVMRGSLRVLKYLSEAEPTPLLCKEDVLTLNLLHFAAGHGRVDVVRFLMKLNPDAVYHRDQDGALPIHMTCTTFTEGNAQQFHMIRRILLEDYIQRNHLEDCNIMGNEEEESHDEVAIHILEWFFPRVHSTKDSIKRYVEDIARIMNCHHVSIPLLCAAIRISTPHSHLKCIIDLVNNSAKVRDYTNRLPIHLAVERGMNFSEGLKDIIEAYPVAAYEVDPKTLMYPFALAARSEEPCNLDGIYELMRQHPESLNITRH